MTDDRYAPFLALIAEEPDDTLLRFGLARMYAQDERHAEAVEHLEHAVRADPQYSAAWRELGRARTAVGDLAGARAAYESGLPAAEAKGDLQTLKELRVFLARLDDPAE